MTSNPNIQKSWFSRAKTYIFIGLPVCFGLAPFPGLGFYYPIRDALRGHPLGQHGTQPSNMTGLWVRDDGADRSYTGQAFYLMPDGKVGQVSGMTVRRWHFDNDVLYIDSVSLCGNCYQGNITSEYKVTYPVSDQMSIREKETDVDRRFRGSYRRIEITDDLKSQLAKASGSDVDEERSKALSILGAIRSFELKSKS